MNLAQSISDKLDFLWIPSANTEIALSKQVQTSPENYSYNPITTPPLTPLLQPLNAAITSLPFLSDLFILLRFQRSRAMLQSFPMPRAMACCDAMHPVPPPQPLPKQQQSIPKRMVIPVLPVPSPWNPGVHWCSPVNKDEWRCSSPLGTCDN